MLSLLASCNIHQLVTPLLSCREPSVVEAVLLTLLRFTKNSATNGYITALNVEEPLLQVLEDRPLPIKRIGAELLVWLCQDEANREHIKALRGIPLVLKLLLSDDLVLLTLSAKVIERLAQMDDARCDIAQLGGVGLLLKHLRPQKEVEQVDRPISGQSDNFATPLPPIDDTEICLSTVMGCSVSLSPCLPALAILQCPLDARCKWPAALAFC